jgi:hypothetical protein
MTVDPRFERRVVAELVRQERAARRRSPTRNGDGPRTTTAGETPSNGSRPAFAGSLRRGLLAPPPPRPLRPALLKDAEQ